MTVASTPSPSSQGSPHAAPAFTPSPSCPGTPHAAPAFNSSRSDISHYDDGTPHAVLAFPPSSTESNDERHSFLSPVSQAADQFTGNLGSLDQATRAFRTLRRKEGAKKPGRPRNPFGDSRLSLESVTGEFRLAIEAWKRNSGGSNVLYFVGGPYIVAHTLTSSSSSSRKWSTMWIQKLPRPSTLPPSTESGDVLNVCCACLMKAEEAGRVNAYFMASEERNVGLEESCFCSKSYRWALCDLGMSLSELFDKQQSFLCSLVDNNTNANSSSAFSFSLGSPSGNEGDGWWPTESLKDDEYFPVGRIKSPYNPRVAAVIRTRKHIFNGSSSEALSVDRDISLSSLVSVVVLARPRKKSRTSSAPACTMSCKTCQENSSGCACKSACRPFIPSASSIETELWEEQDVEEQVEVVDDSLEDDDSGFNGGGANRRMKKGKDGILRILSSSLPLPLFPDHCADDEDDRISKFVQRREGETE